MKSMGVLELTASFLLANGYFNAYGNAARKDEHDYVIHLGDYLYETGKDGERATKPEGAIFSLHDYRTRHGQVSFPWNRVCTQCATL